MNGHISAVTWLVADLYLVATLAGWAVTATWLRRRLLPELSGSAATLATVVAGLLVAVFQGEALGLAALLYAPALAATAVAVPALLLVVWGIPGAARRPPAHLEARDLVGAAIGVALATSHFAGPMLETLRQGYHELDSLSYHLPYAVDFVQRHQVRSYAYAGPEATSTFQPLNSELLDAELMLGTHRDVLVSTTNFFWYGLALLAGWVVGRSSGHPGRAGVSCAITGGVIGLPLFAAILPGEPMNDVAGIALTLSAVALWLCTSSTTSHLAAVSAAAGLAMGTKAPELTVAGPLLLLLIVSAARRRHFIGVAASAGSALLGGGFWYVRNAVIAGDPLAPANLPLLPKVDLGAVGAIDFSVAHYLGHGGLLPSVFLGQMTYYWGRAWPGLVALAIVIPLSVLVDRTTRGRARHLAVLGLVGELVYVITPSGALGPPTADNLFAINFRYAVPAILVALLAPAADLSRRRRRVRDLQLVVTLVLVSAETLLPARARGTIEGPHLPNAALALGCVAAAAVFVGVSVIRTRHLRALATTALAGALLAAATIVGAHTATRERALYPGVADLEPALDGLAPRTVVVADIRLDYVAQGRTFARRVVPLGVKLPRGGFREVGSCRELSQQLTASGATALLVVKVPIASPSPAVLGWLAQVRPDLIASNEQADLYRLDPAAPRNCT